MSVTLTNTSGRCQTFVLAHESFCSQAGTCSCAMTEGRQPRRLPAAVTLPTGESVAALHDAVLALPEVVRAIRRGELVSVRESAEAVEPTPKSKRGAS